VPGVNTKTEEETAIVSNIGLRGLASSEAKSLLLEDGVPVAPGLLIGNDRYFNPAHSAHRAHRGAEGLLLPAVRPLDDRWRGELPDEDAGRRSARLGARRLVRNP
jgi:hypothetical protein